MGLGFSGLGDIVQTGAGLGSGETGADGLSVSAVVETDPSFSSVVLLTDWAGNDGDTTATDLSNSNHDFSLAFIGNVQIDTAIKHLGENTLLYDGTGDRIQLADSADWDFGTGDFTVELGVYMDTVASAVGFIGQYNPPATGWVLRFDPAFGGNLLFQNGDVSSITRSWSPSTATMYHVAVSKASNVIRLFVDGGLLSSANGDNVDYGGGTAVLRIGAKTSLAELIDGNIGAVRVTKGVGRYTASFTPPTTMYPTS